jgi:small subunit ribosomal protein S15
LSKPVVFGRKMAITNEKKQETIRTFHWDEQDTGSPGAQVALLTARINDLTERFKTHAKDRVNRPGLLMKEFRRADSWVGNSRIQTVGFRRIRTR